MRIRPALPKDDHAIAQLTFNAFKNHPHHAPGAEPTEHKIIQRLRETHCLTLSLVAVESSNIIGQISFSPVHINGQKSTWFGSAPLSVAPHRQKTGLGSNWSGRA